MSCGMSCVRVSRRPPRARPETPPPPRPPGVDAVDVTVLMRPFMVRVHVSGETACMHVSSLLWESGSPLPCKAGVIARPELWSLHKHLARTLTKSPGFALQGLERLGLDS
eukprot:3687969-Prymnesium_polylepis.3